jgi:uncharacterized membrane protein (TIGR01666 family)
MDLVRTYKSFVNSYYLNESFRITAGVLIPAFLMLYLDMLQSGVIISLGALFVSLTDHPGPIHHRRNGMLVCIAVIFFVSLISGLVNTSPLLFGLLILVFCFVFSMIGVYGTRAGAVGIAALVLLVLDIGQQRQGWEVVKYALLISSGGLWYMCFSMLLYNFRPYRLIQQALGEWIQSIAEFLQLRSEFYKKQVDYSSTSMRLLQQQATVQQRQDVVNGLIFKTRSVVKETTKTGRILVMMYLDASEMFEKIMTSYQSYSTLHDYFDETDILERTRLLLIRLSAELHELGIAIKSGTASGINSTLLSEVDDTKKMFRELRETYLKPDNINGFISLKRILDSIQDLTDRLQTLHKYTAYDGSVRKRKRHEVDYNTFITSEPIRLQLLLDNLSIKSDIFRHSIRLSIAVIVGYIVSLFFTLGHGYWILLTIIVILKPAYSLSKKRNTDRLFGTIIGVLVGFVVLLAVHNTVSLLIIMILFMIGYFSTMRTNYFLSVLLMTPYVVLFFHMLYPGELSSILKDRVIDTAIGSAIAFTSILFVLPSWERQKITPLMIKMLEEGLKYFTTTADGFTQDKHTTTHNIHLARKEALVALANLSDAFNRMLSEPKSQQKGIEDIHRYVVLNHMFTSYVASLSGYLKLDLKCRSIEELQKVIEGIKQNLLKAINILNKKTADLNTDSYKESLNQLNEQADTLLDKRKLELEQGQLETPTIQLLYDLRSVTDQFNRIYRVSKDLNKVSTATSLHL